MSTIEDNPKGRHEDLVESASSEPRSSNPFAQSSNITVSVPESIAVRLVDASVLTDYEIWSFVTSVLSSAVVGFLVGYFQAEEVNEGLFGAVTGVFALLMFVAGGMALAKRRALTKRTKKLRFSVGEQLSSDEDNRHAG